MREKIQQLTKKSRRFLTNTAVRAPGLLVSFSHSHMRVLLSDARAFAAVAQVCVALDTCKVRETNKICIYVEKEVASVSQSEVGNTEKNEQAQGPLKRVDSYGCTRTQCTLRTPKGRKKMSQSTASLLVSSRRE